jgi:hypothetical protein
MGVPSKSDVASALEQAGQTLEFVVRDSGKEIETAGSQFKDLARDTGTILELAAKVIGCVEDESVSSVHTRVQTLVAEAKGFIQERLRATAGILETVTSEAQLLGKLSQLTRGQKSIARETQVLSVLTNIEVARLGQLGTGFQYLAHELDEFSQSVARGTKELSSHTDERKSVVENTKRMLAAGLPRIRQEFTRIEGDLTAALAAVDSSHAELTKVPAIFSTCVEQIAGQIDGVVAAVQAYDITRQQLDHVSEALAWIAGKMTGIEEEESNAEHDLPMVWAGLNIQDYQLKNIRRTVDSWLEQIGLCMRGILRISSSELMGIAPLVFKQESELSSQLVHIERLEQECEADNEEVQSTFTGLSNLMQLVAEHQKEFGYVRNRMQLLTFNSMVEASHLGSRADTILEISQSIKRISFAWGGMTVRSEQAMKEILNLVDQARDGMQAFSRESCGALEKARAITREGLQNLHAAAEFAAERAVEIEAVTGRLRAKIAVIGATRDRLEASLQLIGTVLGVVEEIRCHLQADCPRARELCDQEETEAFYSATYTTEMEREVLRAALAGAALPQMQGYLAGNSVELF